MKTCNCCKQEKPIEDFWPCHKVFSPDLRMPQCKECKLTPREVKVKIPLNNLDECLL